MWERTVYKKAGLILISNETKFKQEINLLAYPSGRNNKTIREILPIFIINRFILISSY